MSILPIRVWAEERRERWHTTHVPSRASRKTGARLLRVVVMLTTRVLQTSLSLLRVVAATSCDLRTWGWRASGSVASVDVVRRREANSLWHVSREKMRRTTGSFVEPLVFVYRPLSRRARLRAAVDGRREAQEESGMQRRRRLRVCVSL